MTNIISNLYEIPGNNLLSIVLKNNMIMRELLEKIFCSAWKCGGKKQFPPHLIIKNGDPWYKQGKNVKLLNAVNTYVNLVDDLSKTRTNDEIVNLYEASMGNYDYFLNRMKEKLVILGHTHNPLLQIHERKDPFIDRVEDSIVNFFTHSKKTALGGNIVYVNSGGWIHKNPNFVEIVFSKTSVLSVHLKIYNGGTIHDSHLMGQHYFKKK